MTDPTLASDRRRATALVCHWGRNNIDGVNAVITEAQDVDRITPMIIEILSLHSEVATILLTEDGIACSSQEAHRIATAALDGRDDPVSHDCHRAGRLMFAYAKPDLDEINAVLREAVEANRATELILALLELYRHILPQAYTELGLRVLGRSILEWAAKEQP